MGDQYLNDCLVTFIEREFFLRVRECDIISRFQAMKERKVKTTIRIMKENKQKVSATLYL